MGTECALRASTFHAYCYEMLERCGRGFRVIDKKDLWVYLRMRLEKLPLEHFRPARNPGEFLDALLGFFDRCHDELITPDIYQPPTYWHEMVRRVYPRYQELLRQSNGLDFDDLLLEVVRLLDALLSLVLPFATAMDALRQEK